MEDVRKTGVKPLKGVDKQQADANRAKALKVQQERIAAQKAAEKRALDERYEQSKRATQAIQTNYKGTKNRRQVLAEASSLAHTETNLGLKYPEYGQSTYDANAQYGDLAHLNDFRAEEQPWYVKVGAGIAKAGTLAATTFVDGTAGLVYGAVSSIVNGDVSKLWDNDLSNGLAEINKASEEFFKNYYTEDEQNNPLAWRNILSANFLGDKLLKNVGFMIGAAYSGKVWTAPLQLVKTIGMASAIKKSAQLAKQIGAARRAAKITDSVGTGLGIFMAAVNEGRIEANNNAHDWMDLQNTKAKDDHEANIEYIKANYSGAEAIQMLKNENDNYNQKLAEIQESGAFMGNHDLLFNLPILTASNWIGFGKFFTRGFKTAKQLQGGVGRELIGEIGNYAANRSKTGMALSLAKSALSEGAEEMAQGMASRVSGIAAEQKLDSYVNSVLDPKANESLVDWSKAFSKGISESLQDEGAWEEFLVGSLSGAIGMPTFRRAKTKEGKWQSPIGFSGGIWNEGKEYLKQWKREAQVADYLNERCKDPTFKSKYQALLRYKHFSEIQEEALKNNDKFEFNNAELSMLINDIQMFDMAGRLDDFRFMVDSALTTSDDNLQSIVENTISKETGRGPFIDNNGNSMVASEEGKQKMIDRLEETKASIHKAIKAYTEAKDDLLFLNPNLGLPENDEKLRELIWLKNTADSLADRGVEMSEDIQDHFYYFSEYLNINIEKLEKEIDRLQARLDKHAKRKRKASKKTMVKMALVEANKQLAEDSLKGLERTKDLLKHMSELNKMPLFNMLSSSENSAMMEALSKMFDDSRYTDISPAEREELQSKLKDIQRAGKTREAYLNRYEEYLKNPQKQEEAHANARKKAEDAEKEKAFTDKVNTIRTSEVSDIADRVERGEFDLEGLDDTEDEDADAIKAKVKEVKDIIQAKKSILKRIDSSNLSSSAKKAAKSMILNNKANSLKELYDITREAFYNTSEGLDLTAEEKEALNALDEVERNKKLKELKEQSEEEARAELQNIFKEYEDDKANGDDFNLSDEQRAALDAAFAQDSPETGSDPVERLTPVGEQKKEEQQSERTLTTISDGKKNTPQGDVTDAPEDPTVNEQKEEEAQQKKQQLPEQHHYYKSCTTQEVTYRGQSKLKLPVGHHKPFHETELDKQAKLHEIIHTFLKENGAFERLNAGMLKKGMKVTIGTSVSLNKKVGTLVPLLLIEDPENPGNMVIVGDMISAIDSYTQFPFYQSFLNTLNKNLDDISKNFADSTLENALIDLGVQLDVEDMLLGRPDYSPRTKRRTLNEISEGQGFKLAVATKNPNVVVVDSGSVTEANSNQTKTEKKVEVPEHQTAGQPFVLVGDEHNGYMCVPIGLVRFNLQEAQKYAIGRELLKVASDLNRLNDFSPRELTALKDSLQSLLNLEHLWINKSKAGNWVITYKTKYMEKPQRLSYNPKTAVDNNGNVNIAERVLTVFQKANVGYQIDISKMNTDEQIDGIPYNEAIGEIASTNLESLHLINNFPILSYMDAEGNPISALSPREDRGKPKPRVVSKNEKKLEEISAKQKDIRRPTTEDNTYGISNKSHERVHTVMGDNSKTEMSKQAKANGTRAKTAGTEIDAIIRKIFEIADELFEKGREDELVAELLKIKYNNTIITEEAFKRLAESIVSLKRYFMSDTATHKPERVFANNIVIGANLNGVDVAGELDIITVDTEGKVRIYDIKTSKNSFGKETYDKAQSYQKISTKEEHTKQLNFYAEILKKYGIEVESLHILPIFVEFEQGLNHTEDKADPVVSVKGLPLINLDRNPGVVTESIAEYKKEKELNKESPSERNEALSKLEKDSFIASEFDENKDILELLDDNSIAQLAYLANTPKSMKSWKAFLMNINRGSDLNKEEIQKAFDRSFRPDFSKQKEEDKKSPIWNKKKELRRIARMFPGLSKEQRIRIVDSIEKVAEDPDVRAWGSYYNGIIILFKNAIAGTGYHEAFHAVIDRLFTLREYAELFELGHKQHPNLNDEDVEEKMADDFKEYCLLRENANLGQRLKYFFKDLWTFISSLWNAKDSLPRIYSRIYRGKYAKRREAYGNTSAARNSDSYTQEMKDIKEAAIKNGTFMKAPNGQPTKLNERQWLQVRTKAFKDWFGDWEHAVGGMVQDKQSYYRGTINRPTIDENGNLVLKGRTDSLYTKIGHSEEGVSLANGDMQLAIEYGLGQMEVASNLAYESYDADLELERISNEGYYLIRIDKDAVSNKIIHNGEEVKATGDVIIPEGSYVIEHISDDGNKSEIEGRWNIKGVSKIVDENGEPLVVYHHTDDNNLTEFSTEFDNYFTKFKNGTKKAIFFTGTENPANNTVLQRKYKLSVFLNIKDPIERIGTKEQLRTQGKSFTTTINESAEGKTDGVIFHGIDDNQELNQEIYVIHNPNQVKSATDNIGTFRSDNNDIRYSRIKPGEEVGTKRLLNKGSDLNLSEKEKDSIYENYVNLMDRKREGKAISREKFEYMYNNLQVFNVGSTYIFGEWDSENNIFKGRLLSSNNIRTLYNGLDELLATTPFMASVPGDIGKMLEKKGMYKIQAKKPYNFRGEDMIKNLYFSSKELAEKVFNKDASLITDKDVQSYDKFFNFYKLIKDLSTAAKNKEYSKIFPLLKQLGIYDLNAYRYYKKFHNNDLSPEEIQQLVKNIINNAASIKAKIEDSDIVNSPEVYDNMNTELNKMLVRYLSKFGFKTETLEDIQEKLGVDGFTYIDALNKIIYTQKNNNTDFPEKAGEIIAYMMQYNPLITEIKSQLKKLPSYSNREDYDTIIGEMIAKELHKQTNTEMPKSLIDKIKALIKEFFSIINPKRMARINRNVSYIAQNIILQNQALVTASQYKPGAIGKPLARVDMERAINSEQFAKDIVDKMGDTFILVGSLALAPQGTVLRPTDNLVHDLDWVSPLSREKTRKTFEKMFPNNKYIREIVNNNSTTDTWLIVPDGYSIKNLKLEGDNNKIISYDIVDSNDNVVSSYYLDGKEERFTNESIKGKAIDIFTNTKDHNPKRVMVNGKNLNIADWHAVFQAKMEFSRIKDIWDYNRFVPKENTSEGFKANQSYNDLSFEQKENLKRRFKYTSDEQMLQTWLLLTEEQREYAVECS